MQGEAVKISFLKRRIINNYESLLYVEQLFGRIRIGQQARVQIVTFSSHGMQQFEVVHCHL